MYLYINTIDEKFNNASIWKSINQEFQSQSPKWRPGKEIYGIKKRGNSDYFMFILLVALLYRAFIVERVTSRRWEKFWLPLSKDYLKRKKDTGRFENIWMNTGRLVNSIEIKHEPWNSRIRIGINPNDYYEIDTTKGKRKIPVLLVAKFLEYGTDKCPARPLFRRAKEYIGKNIHRYYDKFDKLLDLYI